MDEAYRRQFGSAIRAADGMADEDGTFPARRDLRSGRWDVAALPRARNGTALAVIVAGVAALLWFAG